MGDMSDCKQYREMSQEVLQVLNGPENLSDTIHQILDVMKKRTGFDAIGFRLQDGEDFPYFGQRGFSQEFLLMENSLTERTTDGGVCRDKDGNVRLECTCGLVISGKTDPASPLFTPGGSFWINESVPLLDIPSNEDPRFHPRNQCIHHDYASVALVPIRNRNTIVGLIQFNDKRKGCFTLDLIEFLEGIASRIGDALLRKQIEAKLRESENRYRALFENMMEGVAYCKILYDDFDSPIDFICLNVNNSFGRQTGLTNVIGKKITELFPGITQSFQDLFETYVRVASTGQPEKFKINFKPLSKWFDVSVYSVGREEFVAVFDNITERKQADELLQESENKFSILFKKASLPAVLSRLPDYVLVDVNDAWTQLFGYTKEEVIGKTSYELGINRDVERRARTINEVRLHNQVFKLEQSLFSKSGEAHDVLTNINVIKIDGQDYAITSVQDITEQKQSEIALRESEERFRTLFDTMMIGFCIIEVLFDPDDKPVDYRFLEINSAFALQTGLENVQGRLMRELAPNNEEYWYEIYGNIVLTGEPMRFENKAGALNRWYDVYAYRFGRPKDRQVAIAFNDITYRKQAAEQMKAALAEKEVMLKEIHHRVKNNLQVISSLVNLQANNLSDERMRDELNDVEDRIRSMALIHETMYQASDLAQLNFAEYATSLLHSLWRSHGTLAAKARLNLALAPVALSIEKAVPCGLILNELASNALKHAFPNSIDGEVTVGLEHDTTTDTAYMWVRDNGVGLSPGLDWRQTSSLGLHLVQILTGQLCGSVDTGTGPDTEFRVAFPLNGSQS